MLRKTASLILCFCFLFPFADAAAYAADEEPVQYVALGDSIAAYFGLEEGQGYAELLADKLIREGGYSQVSLENLAQSGDDSQDLLRKIEENKDIIANADIVTICIGGNNFLGTLVTGMLSPLGLSGRTLESGADYLYNMEISDDLFKLAAGGLQAPEIQASLARGIARFKADLPEIIANIRAIAPSAEIYMMTIYNPLEPEHPIYPLLDPIETQINAMVKGAEDVTVIDAYAAFEEYNGQGLKDWLSLGSIDPHPSVYGQRLIANLHYKAITGKDSDDIVEIDPESTPLPLPAIPAVDEAENSPATPDTDIISTPDPTSEPETTPTSEDSNSSFAWLIVILILLVGAVGFYVFRRKK